MTIDPTTKFRNSHEWVKVETDNIARVGISNFAQDSLGDIVYVELPEIGISVAQGDEIATVESVKAVSQVYAPINGEIIEVNDALSDKGELINESPYEDGWLVKIRYSDSKQLDELLDGVAYEQFLES